MNKIYEYIDVKQIIDSFTRQLYLVALSDIATLNQLSNLFPVCHKPVQHHQ